MLSIVLRVVALLLFLLAACNQALFSQPPAALIGWGLACWVLATVVGGVGPAVPASLHRPVGE